MKWSGQPAYTQETGYQPPGGFRQNRALEAEMSGKGVENGREILVYGEQDRYLILKIERGKIFVHNQRTKKEKSIGVGAIEKVLPKNDLPE